MKISFYTIAKDEIYWIEPCLLSIKDVADEIVFVDNGSTDGTPEKVEALMKKHKLPIRMFSFPKETDLSEVRNFAISKCSNEWLFAWDADFVAFEQASKHSIQRMLNLFEHKRFYDRYAAINMPCPIMRYFMGKAPKAEQMHPANCYMINKKFVSIKMHANRGWDDRVFRGGRKPIVHRDYCFISVDVKSDERCMLRRFRSKWRLYRAKHKLDISLRDYIKNVVKQDINDASFIYKVPAVNFSYEIPKILTRYLMKPPYKTIMKGGKVVGRRFDFDRLRKLEL